MKKIHFLLGTLVFFTILLINIQSIKAAAGDIYVDIKDELTADLSGATLYYYCTGGAEESCLDGDACDLDGTADIMVTPVAGASCDATDTITARVEKDGYVADSTLGYAAYDNLAQNNGAASMLFGVKVTATKDGAAYTGATVTVGDSYDTSCSESGATGVYYCAEPVAKTGASAKVFKIGYNDMISSYTDRTAQTSAQSTVTIAYRAMFSGINQPTISQVQAKVSSNSAVISWQTDKPASSTVNYGLSTAYEKRVASAYSVTSHSLTLIGLLPLTTYHYQVVSMDSIGNIVSFPDKTFATLAEGAAEEPLEEPVAGEETGEEIATKPISEMTIEQLKAEVARITALIAQLQTQIAEAQGIQGFTGIPADFKFENTLKYDMQNDEVKYLQIILKSEIGAPTYPEDVPATGWFGSVTEASLIKFQEKYAQDILAPWELTKGTGLVGETTRNKLNQLLGK